MFIEGILYLASLANQDSDFPIGVWLQDPPDALTWRHAGITHYTGLWQGPTAEQLDQLRESGMPVIVMQNEVALQYADVLLNDGRPLILAYSQPDEPDNFPQDSIPDVITNYQTMKANDPTRPVFLNLGQGIGWDSATWCGQGGEINPERDYPGYLQACDIGSFDIYPMNCGNYCGIQDAYCGEAWRVALGVRRLKQYAAPHQIIWSFIETGDINADGEQVTAEQIRAEVWMAIINGASGINYFIHGKSSVSNFDYKALLRPENAEKLAAVTKLNFELRGLGRVLKTPSIPGEVKLTNLSGELPPFPELQEFLVKQWHCKTYLFASSLSANPSLKHFRFRSLSQARIRVIGENRWLQLVNGEFLDQFDGYQAHLYELDEVP